MSAVLVIAGSDSSGGAGLTRDVRTLAHFGAGALCALTAVTAQSDARVSAVHLLPPELVRAQIEAALDTGRVAAIKIGMLGTGAIALAVAASLPPRSTIPLVLDPVLAASSGGELLDAAGRRALLDTLLPLATVVTPNIPEAAALLRTDSARGEAERLQQAAALLALGPEAVLLKGGHDDGPEAADLLLARDAPPYWLRARRGSAARRGTGCTLSSAIAAGLAARLPLTTSCERAKQHVTQLVLHGD